MSQQESSTHTIKMVVFDKETSPKLSESVVLVLGSNLSGATDLQLALQRRIEEEEIVDPQVLVVRDASDIEEAFSAARTLKGVVLLPEMRQYSPESERTMSIGSYNSGIVELVEKLCEEHNVPLVKIENHQDSKQIQEKPVTFLGS